MTKPTKTKPPAVAIDGRARAVIEGIAPAVDGEVTIEEYVVESGDTLLSIAIEFGMSVEDLRSLNLLESDALSVGQPLQVRVTPPTPMPTPEPFLYTVQAGDTLSKIAKQYYGNANAYMKIFDANKDQLKDPNKIQVGQVLKIPAA